MRLTTIITTFVVVSAAWGGELQPGIFEGGRLIEGPGAELAAHADGMQLGYSDGRLVLDNGLVRLVLQKDSTGFRREYHAIDEAGNWRLVLRDSQRGEHLPTASASGGAPNPIAFQRVEIARNDERGVVLRLRAATTRAALTATITLEPQSNVFRVLQEADLQGRWMLEQLQTNLAFVPLQNEANARSQRNGDFIWTPGFRTDSRDVVGDEAFGTPAIIVQRGRILAAILPDIAEKRRFRGMQSAVAVDRTHNAIWLSYGIRKYEQRESGFHYHTSAMIYDLADVNLRYGYRVLLDAQAEPAQGYRTVLNSLGPLPQPEPEQQAALQQKPAQAFREVVWPEVGRHFREEEMLSFNVEKQDLRSAYGLALDARRTGNDDKLKLARSIAQAALSAPVERGLTPTAATRRNGQLEWRFKEIAGDRVYSTRDLSNTAMWLLAWRQFLPREEAAIIERCRAYGDKLVRLQLPSGCIPAFIKADDFSPVREILYETGAESAESAAFLAELHAVTGDEKYLISAMTVLQYITTSVLPQGRWKDSSTLDMPVQGLGVTHPQSVASMISAARTALAIHAHTGRSDYLEVAFRLADYIALYQNNWYAPWLRGPYGAVVSRNYDAVFDPGLQSDAAEIFLKAYRAGGAQVYLDRASAALRAGFALVDAADTTALSGTPASMLAQFDILASEFGDAFIYLTRVDPLGPDVPAVGIDACLISEINISPDTIRFDLTSPFDWEEPALVRIFIGENPRKIIANGVTVGRFTQAELAEGILIEVRGPRPVEEPDVDDELPVEQDE